MGLVEQGESFLLDAYTKKNLETAIRRGLASEPDSIQLKLSLGKYYLFSRNNLRESRRMAHDVLRIDREHYGAWELLGAIEHKIDREQSIISYQRAMDFALKQDNFEEAYKIQRYLMPELLAAINDRLKANPDEANLRKASELLGTIDQQVEILERKQRLEEQKADSQLALNLAYTQGVRLSCSAFIRFLRDPAMKATSLAEFGQARDHFNEILGLADQVDGSTAGTRENLTSGLKNFADVQLLELDRRVRVCHLETEFYPKTDQTR